MSHHDAFAAGENLRSEADQLASLKELLFSEERAELGQLRQRLEQSGMTPDELSDLLPSAVWKAAARDEQLSEALGPLFSKAIKSAIKNDADSIAEAISPIMGPAIRATIQQSIRGMVQSLNKTLEHSVSAKGLKWRWEAMTTGKSFAEVVLLHTLRYRVVQAFLIDRDTGLLIMHAAFDEMAENVDLASGMLTAIQDFVRDSFGGAESDSLSNMSFGNQTVWIETGTHAFLALVIEGEAPSSLRTYMQETLEQLHVRFGQELDAYDGDSAPFAAAQPLMEECLVSAYEEDEKEQAEETAAPLARKKKLQLWQKALIVATVASVLIGGYVLNSRSAHRRHVREIRRKLAAPASVDLRLQDEVLIGSGEAHSDWIQETTRLATRLLGVTDTQLSEIKNLDKAWQDYLQALRVTPGLVVTDSNAADGQYTLSGLRDPLAEHPSELIKRFSLASESVTARWSPFQSLEPSIIAKRIVAAMPANDTKIDWELTGNTLRFTGTAPAKWVASARERATPLAVDTLEIDFQGVRRPSPPLPTAAPPIDVRELINRLGLDRSYLLFEPGSDSLSAQHTALLPTLAKKLKQAITAGNAAGQEVTITLVAIGANKGGDGKPTATELGKRRAESAWKQLRQFDVPAGSVLIQGIPSGTSAKLPAGFSKEMESRCCLVRITLTPTTKNP